MSRNEIEGRYVGHTTGYFKVELSGVKAMGYNREHRRVHGKPKAVRVRLKFSDLVGPETARNAMLERRLGLSPGALLRHADEAVAWSASAIGLGSYFEWDNAVRKCFAASAYEFAQQFAANIKTDEQIEACTQAAGLEAELKALIKPSNESNHDICTDNQS